MELRQAYSGQGESGKKRIADIKAIQKSTAFKWYHWWRSVAYALRTANNPNNTESTELLF